MLTVAFALEFPKNREGHYIRQPLGEIPGRTWPEISILKQNSVILQGKYIYTHISIVF